jgi:putative membrane protein insertion efficiency factor
MAGYRAMQKIVIGLIQAYRYVLSPWVGRSCRFFPTCSMYAEQAIRDHGLRLGSWLTLKRVCRCHPFHPGGVDPVPTPRGQ